LVLAVALYFLIRRLPYFKDNKMTRKTKKSFQGFSLITLRRKWRAFSRNLIDRIKNISFKKRKKEKEPVEKKKAKVDVDKSYKKAKQIYEQGDKNLAEKMLIRLISIKPSDARLYYLLHKIYLDKDNLKEAALSLNEATKRKQDGFWYMELANIYHQLDKSRLEEKALKSAIEMNNMIAVRWSKLAQVQLKQGKTKQSLESIERALNIEPNNRNYQEIKKQIIK
jgi:tetratricopeptide (TPR) repeat protein